MSTAARAAAATLAPATTLQQGESQGREARHLAGKGVKHMGLATAKATHP